MIIKKRRYLKGGKKPETKTEDEIEDENYEIFETFQRLERIKEVKINDEIFRLKYSNKYKEGSINIEVNLLYNIKLNRKEILDELGFLTKKEELEEYLIDLLKEKLPDRAFDKPIKKKEEKKEEKKEDKKKEDKPKKEKKIKEDKPKEEKPKKEKKVKAVLPLPSQIDKVKLDDILNNDAFKKLAGDIEKSITNLSNNKKFRYLDNLLNKDKFSDKQNAQKYIDGIIKKYQNQLDNTIEKYKKLNFNDQGARSFGDIYYRKVRFDEYATEEQKKIIEDLHNKPQQEEKKEVKKEVKKEDKPKEEKKEVKPKEEIKPIEPKKEIQKEVKKAEKQPKQKKQRKPKKEVDENLIAFGTVMVGVPKTMAFIDKKGKEKEVDVLTLKNNIKSKDKKKAIKLKTHQENNIKFDEGEKNDKGKIKFNSAEITLPEKMKYVDKNLKFKEKDTLTKKGNLSSAVKMKPIILKGRTEDKISKVKIKEKKEDIKNEQKKIIEEKANIENEDEKQEEIKEIVKEVEEKYENQEQIIEEIQKLNKEELTNIKNEFVNDEVDDYDKKMKELDIKIKDKNIKKLTDFLDVVKSMMIYLNSDRKTNFKTEKQRKMYNDMFNAMKGFDFYPTPSKYGEMLVELTKCESFRDQCHILEAGTGLASLSLPFILNGIDITLTELNNTFYEILKPLNELPNVNVIEGDFFKTYNKKELEKGIAKDFDTIIMNPPFEAYINGKMEKKGYHYFILKSAQILNYSKRKGKELKLYVICPKIDFKGLGNDKKLVEGEVCNYEPAQSILKNANKMYELELEEYEDKKKTIYEQPFYQCRFICDVSGFRKITNAGPRDLGMTFGLFEFIHSMSYGSDERFDSANIVKQRKKMKEYIKGNGADVSKLGTKDMNKQNLNKFTNFFKSKSNIPSFFGF